MSGRLLGAIIVPVVVLSVSLAASVASSHRDAERAAVISEHVAVLRQLVDLRSAVFRERLALEIFVPSRRPPPDRLAGTAFGAQIVADPAQLTERTNEALAALDPADRPFTREDLDRARALPVDDTRTGGATQGAFDDVDAKLRAAMAADLTTVRETAIDLGDVGLIRAGTRLDRSIRLPEEAASLVATVADLWTAEPADRPATQSEAAMALATFDSSARRLAEAEAAQDGPLPLTVAVLQMPDPLREATDDVLAGSLSTESRPTGEPLEVGLALLTGVDWLLEVDRLPIEAAEAAILASGRVSSDGRASEQRTAALAAIAVLGSIAAAVLFGRSIVRPVRRLTSQAERIGSGHLDLERDLRGPPEIVRASDAMNEMAENLALLERKSQALARADFADESLQEPLPGRLGASLQLSMAVLSESIEQRESLQSRLEFEASHDALTGIGNRSSLTSALNRMRDDAAGSGGRVAVTFIDLDDFKDINDRHGHSLGDEALKVIATRMLDVAPAPALVARLGGDEFVIAVSDVASIDETIELARRVIDSVSRPIEIAGRTLEVRASAGIAVAGDGVGIGGGDPATIDPSALLHMADLAVYSAKLDPHDDVALYDDELDRRLIHHREMEASVRSALTEGADELYLVFQPIMSADGTQVPGVEALLRWTKPGVGPIFPDQFIPVAESSDLIIDVDAWVIEAALRQLSAWDERGFVPPIAVAVNVSGRSLLDRGFVDRVAGALSRSKARPELLSVEVTETALVSDLGLAAAQLAKLRELGIRVAIDDFGTGYTSVAHLRALPVDELKIDGSFVQELDEQENRVLIEMITQLAHQLRLPVVAEGVETIEQVEVLRTIGCDRLQGYHFSRPLEPDALEAWILERSAATRGPETGSS